MNLSDRLMNRGQRNPNNINVMTAIISRLKQPSTIKGLLALASLFGINMTDDVINAVSEVVLAGLALWELIRHEKQIPKAEVIDD